METAIKERATAQGVADLLWEEIHNLKAGETSAANLSAITNASGKIFTAYILKMKYAQMTGALVDKDATYFIGETKKTIEDNRKGK